jgi:glutaredoxin 3
MCGFCSAAKNLLKSKGVSFRELDATFSAQLRQEMVQETKGGSTFPQIFIGKQHVGGCDELFGLESAGKLDAMLES